MHNNFNVAIACLIRMQFKYFVVHSMHYLFQWRLGSSQTSNCIEQLHGSVGISIFCRRLLQLCHRCKYDSEEVIYILIYLSSCVMGVIRNVIYLSSCVMGVIRNVIIYLLLSESRYVVISRC